jgi:hypothetical protein
MRRRVKSTEEVWRGGSPEFAITGVMEIFREEIEALGGTVSFDKVRLESAWVPAVRVDLRGDESKRLMRPTFRQAIGELRDWVKEMS